MIFNLNESISCLYLISLGVLIIYDFTLTLVIMSELHHFTIWFNPVICLWLFYVISWFNPDIFYMHILIVFFSCTNLYGWLAILVYCFIMHNSVRTNINIIIGFCHAHLCTNDYPFYFWFSSWTSLHEWLSLFIYFVMHMLVRMTLHTIVSRCSHWSRFFFASSWDLSCQAFEFFEIAVIYGYECVGFS